MLQSKSTYRFYLLSGLMLTAGWLWVGINAYLPHSNFTPCMFKNVTGIPCPSCGATSSVLSIYHFEWERAFIQNPLGYPITAALLVLPVWMIFDAARKKNTLPATYAVAERKLKQPLWLCFMFVAIVINWIWNLCK